MMDGYEYNEKSSINEDDFGAKGNIVSAFDAFRTCYFLPPALSPRIISHNFQCMY